jgi:hypothetical protein
MLKLCDAFFNELSLRRGHIGDTSAWSLDLNRPFGGLDNELSVLRVIGYDMTPHECSHCHNIVDKEAENRARCYARELYADIGDFLRGSWSEYRRLTSK